MSEELLYRFLYALLSCQQSFIFSAFHCAFLTPRFGRKKTFWFISLIICAMCFLSYVVEDSSALRLLQNQFVMVLIVLFFFTDPLLRKIAVMAVVYCLMAVSDLTTQLLWGRTMEAYPFTMDRLLALGLYDIVATAMFFFAYQLLSRRRDLFRREILVLFILGALVPTSILMSFFLLVFSRSSFLTFFFLFLGTPASVVAGWLLTDRITRYRRQAQEQKQLQELQLCEALNRSGFEEIVRQDEALRRLRHDYRNHLSAAVSLIADRRPEQLAAAKELLQQAAAQYAPSVLPACGNRAVDAALAERRAAFEPDGIELTAEGALPAELQVLDLHLCAVCIGLLNCAASAGTGPVRFSAALRGGALELEASGPEPRRHARPDPLTTELLRRYGGRFSAKTEDGTLRLHIHLPDRAPTPA